MPLIDISSESEDSDSEGCNRNCRANSYLWKLVCQRSTNSDTFLMIEHCGSLSKDLEFEHEEETAEINLELLLKRNPLKNI
jgi:hypothetical protein